jgi:archaemetzincin
MSIPAIALTVCSCASYAETPDVDFVKLPPPRKGEWRSVFPEAEQTLDDYRTHMWRALAFEKRFIRILPFGEAHDNDDALLKKLAAYLSAYYMTRTEIEPRRAVPDTVRRRPTRGFGTQYQAEDILKDIWRTLPTGTVARLAVTYHDLYATGPSGADMNFVFGMGGAARRSGVISIARYRMRFPDEPVNNTIVHRVLKVGAHEVGHMFGLMHCATYACAMNGSNSLKESDSRPLHLCPLCLRKLMWHLDTSASVRYTVLAKSYDKLGWKSDASFVRRRAESARVRGQPLAPSGRE